jgi:hypothetical protein
MTTHGSIAAAVVEEENQAVREKIAVATRPQNIVDDTWEDDAIEVTYSDPGQEVRAAGPSFIPALANVFQYLASLTGRPQRVTRFHAIRVPQLSIAEYLTRISTYFQCSNECFVLALVYIDRIVKQHPDFSISVLNIHRLLVTSVMLAAKFFDDVYYSNSYYAKVGGVRTPELNALEASFLRLIDWRLYVFPAEYDQYRVHVLRASQGHMDTSFVLYQQPLSSNCEGQAEGAPWQSAG